MIKYAIIIATSLIVGFGVGSWLLDPSGGDAHEHEQATVYRCPMHPTVVADRPGSCLVCGMDLVADRAEPASVASAGDEMSAVGTIQIDPVTVQNIGVKTQVVSREQLNRTLRTVGRVDYDETSMTDVNTKIAGWVEKLHVDYTGQLVEKGQPLLEIYSPELVAAQEEYLTALDYKRRLEASADADARMGGLDLLEASLQRLRYWDVTDAQIRQLERTDAVGRTMTVYSPQEGIVVHKAVFEGAHIEPGQHLYRIAELSPVWVYADIYEYELPWVREGQAAQVELSYLPGKRFNGTVTHVYPFLDPKTRTVKLRMSFPNPDRALKPEMYANVWIHSEVSTDSLVIPAHAVIHSGERFLAVVSLGGGRFQPREIEIGVEADGSYQVLAGLSEGEQIVTSAQFLIDSESNLKAALRAMVGEKAAVSGDARVGDSAAVPMFGHSSHNGARSAHESHEPRSHTDHTNH